MSGRTVSAASVRTRSIGVAEQVAISLALTTKEPYPIFSDSMTAVRSFDANQISFAAPRPESSEETRASLSPRFPPCATEPSDERYVAPSVVVVAGLCRPDTGLAVLSRASPADNIDFGVAFGLVHDRYCPAAAVSFVQEVMDREPPSVAVADEFRLAEVVDAGLGNIQNPHV
ncbi:hypothetical protein HPB50_010522 [Hyalomma asiaticum]|uniref:Uncharacterized protein n=1 Tax=Hyalomma asiaticum TaxID=266040 RepID=A0ACB7SZI6_HYAAI|nr:hypothetical protein HPB50_010522 [Hyalomma asiaticum]